MKQRTLDEIIKDAIRKEKYQDNEVPLFKRETIDTAKQQIKAWCYGKLAVKKKDCIDMSWEDGFNQCHDESREMIEKGE